jgi:hypothetical protein
MRVVQFNIYSFLLLCTWITLDYGVIRIFWIQLSSWVRSCISDIMIIYIIVISITYEKGIALVLLDIYL